MFDWTIAVVANNISNTKTTTVKTSSTNVLNESFFEHTLCSKITLHPVTLI